MRSGFVRNVLALSLEEKILNGGALLAFVCVFFPWIGGEWLAGRNVTYSGLGFFTSFIGIAILLLHGIILLISLIPLLNGPRIVSKNNTHITRLLIGALGTILSFAVWSVLTKFTFEFSRLEVHFGLYGTIVGSIVVTLYAFLLHQERKRDATKDLFYQQNPPPSSAPPPPQEPEEHRMR